MNVVLKIRDFYHTLSQLQSKQLKYQVKYRLTSVPSLSEIHPSEFGFLPLRMLPLLKSPHFIKAESNGLKADFLHISQTYSDGIQWDDLRHGKLWNYHLQYSDFLKQSELPIEFRKELILDLYQWLKKGTLQPEPYPASLRIMNGIRFLSENSEACAEEDDLCNHVFSDLHFLENRLEYHLLGNHLLENAFALLMGGTAFQKSEWITIAEEIFADQIPEQILKDGAHFERSPMYHIILLFRFLEAFYYLPSDSKLSSQFSGIIEKMLSWLDEMSFQNGDLAHFNDSTNHQTYTKEQIFELAASCGITPKKQIQLSDSGYRKFQNNSFELIADASGIAPSYQPGHSHADSLSFILHVNGNTFITDPSVSMYESSERRNWERSTKAHNTVTYDGQNTADVWSQFRVGKRPNVSILHESSSEIAIQLKHQLQSGDRFIHQRNFRVMDEFVEILDEVNLKKPVEGRLYFDPSVQIKTVTKNHAELSNGASIRFRGIQELVQFTYEFCEGFNRRKRSIGIEYHFIKKASFKIVAPHR